MKFVIYLSCTIIWIVVITILSHQSGEKTYSTSGRIIKKFELSKLSEHRVHRFIRTIAHPIVFFILMVLASLSVKELSIEVVYSAAFCLIWCWFDEFTKKNIKGRHYSLEDVGLNMLGVIFAWIFIASV